MKYAMLVQPSANRVYAQAAPDLARAELAAFAHTALADRIGPAEPLRLGGVDYVGFTAAEPLAEDDLRALANVSSAFAYFELVGEDLLRPVTTTRLDAYDDDLITIQKYAGKTNENFTKLLLNVTALGSAWGDRLLTRKFVVLDPLAGRGTTLNQALMYGWDAYGIEIDGKDFDAYEAFLKTWLRRKRIKHSTETAPLRREGRRLGRRFDVRLTTADQELSLFEADTTNARMLLKRQAVDLIVADLPYGVVHGSRTGGRLSRGPAELLVEALPVWIEILRVGGAIGLSWNIQVAPREVAVDLLEAEGLVVNKSYDGFEHWVDQAITRDIVVARKI